MIIKMKKNRFISAITAIATSVTAVSHHEISALRLDPNGGYPRWKLNNHDSFAVTGIGSKYRLQGAIAALICLFASEQHGGREKIKLL